MSYRIRRIDPFWIAHPAVIAVIFIGLILGLFGYQKGNNVLLFVGGGAMLIGVLVATRPVVSGVLGSLGVFGGLFTFVLFPNPQLSETPVVWKLVSTVFFALLYMGLMDALILLVAALYNFFGGALKMGGINLEIEEATEAGEGEA
ncbi:MAG: hypothetical protein WC728_07420 [Elusimicrobiota bacterium]